MELAILCSVLALALLASVGIFAYYLIEMAKTLESQVKMLNGLDNINAKINERVKERVKIVNSELPRNATFGGTNQANTPPPAPPGEQPPIFTSMIRNDLSEIEREMNRIRNPDIGWNKRESFGEYESVEDV